MFTPNQDFFETTDSPQQNAGRYNPASGDYFMLCPACQADVPSDSVFCPKCGQKLDAPAPANAKESTGADKIKQAVASNRAADDAEVKLWTGSYSPKAMVGNWILAGLITVAAATAGALSAFNPMIVFIAAIVAAAIWIAMLFYVIVLRLSVDYELTTQRFVHRVGLLSRTTNRVEVIDIDDVQVQQGFVERMLGVGTIKILSSDVSDPMLQLKGIADVNRVATLIDNARRDERRKRGLYVEAV